MIHHLKHDRWLPPGGHLEPGEVPHEAVLREVLEETGIQADFLDYAPNLEVEESLETQVPTPFVVLHELIPAKGDQGEHMHYDFIYILEADETELDPRLQEVSDAKWMLLKEIQSVNTFTAVRSIAEKVLQ
jgi:8-oxo-dGTP pyrophosphatase MutT (NUDIX family)